MFLKKANILKKRLFKTYFYIILFIKNDIKINKLSLFIN